MEDLEQGKFKVKAFINIAVYDGSSRYYNGDNAPGSAEIVISSEEDELGNIICFDDINNGINDFEVIQLSESTSKEELSEFVNNNKQWFVDAIQHIIDNPEDNGEM